MANPRFLTDRCINLATVTANPALLTTKPETNLKTQDRAETARSTSTASQEIKLSWPSAQRINMIAMGPHNLTASAQWRVQLYSDAAWTTQVLDNAAANLYGYTGFSTLIDIRDPEFRIYKNSARYWTVQTNVQSAKITITDAANPDGYFDIARLMIGEYFELANQFPFGGMRVWEDCDTKQEGAGSGSLVSDRRENFLRAELSHDMIVHASEGSWLEDLHTYCGRHRDLFISLLPGDGTWEEPRRHGFFKFEAPDPIDRARPIYDRHRITLRGM